METSKMVLKQIKKFKIEVFELEFFYQNEDGYRLAYDYTKGHYLKVITTHFTINPSCYKKTFSQEVNSERKLNQLLGVRDYTKLNLYNDISKALKGINSMYQIRGMKEVLIVKDLSV